MNRMVGLGRMNNQQRVSAKKERTVNQSHRLFNNFPRENSSLRKMKIFNSGLEWYPRIHHQVMVEGLLQSSIIGKDRKAQEIKSKWNAQLRLISKSPNKQPQWIRLDTSTLIVIYAWEPNPHNQHAMNHRNILHHKTYPKTASVEKICRWTITLKQVQTIIGYKRKACHPKDLKQKGLIC